MFRLNECTAGFLPSLPPEELNGLIANLEQLVKALDADNSIALHARVDQSWYMQKLAELCLLRDQRVQAFGRLADIEARLAATAAGINDRIRDDSINSPTSRSYSHNPHVRLSFS